MKTSSGKASSLKACAFAVSRRHSVRRLVAAAAGKLAVSTHHARSAHVRFLDTFDRGLRRAGFVLEHVEFQGDSRLQFRTFGGVQPLVEAPEAALPAFARDIAHARLRSVLAPRIDVRRLLVVAEAHGRFSRAWCRDDEGKAVLVVECFAANDGPARLTVRPLRGYERFARRAIRKLRSMAGVEPDEGEPMLAASGGPDAVFGGVAAPTRPDLEPSERSDSACKRLLASLDAVLDLNAPGVEADLDSECLHDFRVATRKARSLVREMKGVFPQSVARRLSTDLGWLGQRTGPLRDLDVHLIDFGEATAEREAVTDDATAALRDYLEMARRKEYAALCRTLRSVRYRRVRAAFKRFVESEPPARPRSANALIPIEALSAARILKVYRRTLAEGRAIRDESPAEAVHDLRKTCKRLRYLLEFFRGIHSRKPVVRTIERLKRLQDNLGAYQDVQVQRALLEAFRSRAGVTLDASGIESIDAWCAALAERERKTRAEFAVRFAGYDSKSAHKQFMKSLRHQRR